jgi:expansin (peptidoglycan-binding protein)
MYHLDLSIWAFERLAQTKWGVIAVKWRDVPCWHRPKTPARLPSVRSSPGAIYLAARVVADALALLAPLLVRSPP